jgi:hypothetical protein
MNTLWFRAFLATLIFEALVVVPLLGKKYPHVRRFGALVLVNLATHPIVWFVIPALTRPKFSWVESVVISEIWAILLETWGFRLIFKELAWRRCLLIALLANLTSTVVGLALRAVGVPL